MSEIRCFIAIEISKNNNIEKLVKEIEKSGAIVKLVESKNIHITLRFLGDINEDLVYKIEDILKNALLDIKPFKIELYGVGVFPNVNYIKVIWIGIKKTEFLEEIFNKINKEINLIIPDTKTQKFKPHITIGRVKSAKNKEKILNIIKKYQNKKFSDILIETIKLKKSELTSTGPIYTDLIKINLK
jgi:2'-5' RNA ligase